MRPLAALLLAAACALSARAAEDQNLSNKSAMFIDGLKRFLRKNNDDYAELGAVTNRRTGGDQLNYKTFAENTDSKPNEINTNDKHSARRFANIDDKEASMRGTPSQPAELPTSRHVETRPPAKKKKIKRTTSKQEALQKFLRKNEGLIRTFLSSRNMQSSTFLPLSSSTKPTSHIIPFSANSEYQRLSKHFSSNNILSSTPSSSPPAPLLTPSSSSTSSEEQGRALRQLIAAGLRADSADPPQPDQLDMAPASGDKIHNMRIKGRLCQRSVLFPEGPKYDSHGNAYIRSHDDSVSHRDFASTRRPKYILPRCCNCCRKSVLGCE